MRSDAQIIRDHYRLSRLPDTATVAAEIANLYRKADAGTLDDRQLRLYSALDLSERRKVSVLRTLDKT
jgi:hypothetical protein